MANVLSLAMKITADANSVPKSLTPVERAFKQIDAEAAKVTKVFDTFAKSSAAAAATQTQFATDLAFLQSALRTGQINAQQFAEEFAKLQDSAKKTNEAFAEGARLTEESRTAEEKRAAQLERLAELLELGAISQETYNRQVAEVSGANAAAAQEAAAAEAKAAADRQRAAAIIQASLSQEERAQQTFQQSTAELQRLRAAGLLTETQYAAALNKSAEQYAKATVAANKLGDATEDIGKGGTLKFNELSGVLSALPGPLGSVAGRISGLASASEGLGRVFKGGLTPGLQSLGTQFSGLLTKTNIALAGVAAFGTAAVAVTRGLIDLEDRVEKLGNTADKLGVSFEFIQTLEEAANRSGTSIEAVSSAFGKLQKNVTGVDEESKAAQAALKNIGVTAEELQALKPEEQYKLIGERLQGIQDPAQRTATAMNLFGKAGAELLPFFKNLGGASDDMERFGRALTTLDRRRIDEFGAGLDALGVATQGLGQTLLLPFVGLGEGVSKAFAEIIAGVTAVVDPIGQVLEPVLTQIGRVVEIIGIGVGNLGRVVGAVFEPFATVVQGVSQALEPLYDGVVNLFRSFSDSQVAITEWVMSFTPIGVIADNIGVVSDTLGRIVNIITTAFGKAIEYVGELAGQFGELVASSPLLETLGSVASSVFGTIAQVIGDLVSGIGEFVGNLLTIAEYWLGIERSTSNTAAATTAVAENTAETSKEAKKALEERERTFQRLREEVNNAIDDSRKFGEEGRAAAYKYDQAVEALKQRLSAGLIDQEQFRRSVRIAGQVFDEELKGIEDRKQLEIKVKEDAAKAIEKVGDEIDKAAIKADDFGAAGQQALGTFSQRAEELKRQFAAGIIDEKQLEKSVAAANREYDKQIEKIKEANQERQRAAEADRKRSEEILDEMDKTRAVQRDMDAVQREINRLRAEAAKGVLLTPEQQQQLRDLQQAQVELGEKQQAVAQGFEKGYGEAFDKTRDKFNDLAQKAEEFGAAGQAAAQRLAAGLQAAAEQARRGGSAEQYEQEVARQQRLYENELKNLKAVADERKKTTEMVENELLLISVGGDSKRAEAKKNLLAIEEEMLRVQKEQQAARAAGDSQALNDATKRLADLDQVAAKERDIASGAAGQREQMQKQQEDYLKQQGQQQQQIIQQQQKADEERAKAQQAEYERQVKRITDLNTLGSNTVQTADVRTQEGAALVLNLAANAQDPALIEARLQSKYLRQINDNIQTQSRREASQLLAIAGGQFANLFLN